MTFEITTTLAAIFFLLLLSAFFSGSETGLTVASRARMLTLAEEGNARARIVNRMLAAPEKLIGAILLGNTLVDALMAALATNLAVLLLGERLGIGTATAIATISTTLLIVVFGAALPKTWALAAPDGWALAVAPVMRTIVLVATPLTIAIELIVRMVLKLTPNTDDDAANILSAQAELRGTIELQKREGAVVKHDADMLGGVLDLRDLQVLDIMVHRTKMETLNADDPPAKIVAELIKGQFTRVPVWKGGPENIIGVVHVKDLLAALAERSWNVDRLDIMSFAHAPWFVPDTTGVKDQLNAFLRQKAQMALVVDEYGEVQGLVTLEDILEEIVGQIADEHDSHDTAIRPQPDGTVNVDGSVAIRDLNRHMDWRLPDEEATTIAGLVIHEAQTIPEPGQAFTFHGYRFEILRKSRNRITALRVKPALASTRLEAEAGHAKAEERPVREAERPR
jgi:Mg2+/Co2+ transporter CorB